MQHYLYVMLSRTDTKMGRLIRFFTKEEYNHVSLCLDGNLQHFVSFARYRQDVPLAGGYVTESAARLRSCGKSMQVRIFRLEISQADASQLEALFNIADHSDLVYNSLGALLSSCHIRCSIPGAYTCLEFAGAILGDSYHSIAALGDELRHCEIYRGDLFDLLKNTPSAEQIFFQKRGFRKGTWDTIVHFKTLLWRILRLERPEDPIASCSLHISVKNIPQNSV
jgi:hypothetical protein